MDLEEGVVALPNISRTSICLHDQKGDRSEILAEIDR